jgi:chaperonin GroES
MANEQEKAIGEMLEYEEEDSDVRDTEDGGAMVTIDDSPTPGQSEFYANLAEDMPESELAIIGANICDLIERDKESRKRRDEQYEEGLRRTGLGEDAPGGAAFTGASKVVHPMLTKACVDFSSRVMKEIFPTAGPAKERIIGKPTKEKFEKAQRITKFMNWQMTRQMKDFRAELEQLSTQVPLAGVQYLKLTWDARRKRPTPLFVSVDDVLLPYAATNFYTAERKTHVQYITKLEYQRRVQSGMYRDVDLPIVSLMPEPTKSERANDKIEGRNADTYNQDGLRTIFETCVYYDINDEVSPYVISIDKNSQKVLSIYRNWEEDDELQDEMYHMVEFPMIPWRGAYPIGFVHMIGGLSAAATGTLRALLDSGHINNFPGLLKLKGGSGGQTDRIDPTEVHEIEGSFGQDDIRKVMMPMPFNPPSPVLFQLMGFMIDAADTVVRTTFEELADSNANTPVGTTLARIEQGMVVFNAIHGRIHDAMGRVLELLYRINKMYMTEQEIYDDTGELLAYRSDFEGPPNVMPVSDPNISTDTQRFAQTMAVVQRADAKPGLYDPYKVEEMYLRQLKVPDYENLLVAKPEVQEMNAVNENLAATLGRPIAAFPEQDHLAHLQVHLDFMLNPVFGASRLVGSVALPALLGNIKEHVVLWYVNHIVDTASDAAGTDISELMKDSTVEEKQEFDKMLAAASQSVNAQAQETLGAIPQVVEQAIQLLQQFRPPMPQDPATGMMQAEIQRKTAADQAKVQIEAQKMQAQQQTAAQRIQTDIQRLQAELQREQMREQAETERSNAEISARVYMNEQDNQTAKQLAALEVQSGEKIALSTGHGINPN